MWHHFINLLAEAWKSVTVALSTSALSIILYSLAAPVVTFGVTLALVSRQDRNKTFVEHLKQSAIPTLVGFAVPLVLLACVFGWKIITTVYEDHQALVAQANAPKPTCPVCAGCPSCPLAPKPIPKLSSEPEKIHNASATVRVTCTLKNPSKSPGTTSTFMTDAPSYLAGSTGRAFFQTNSASYQRTEEGAVVITENYAVNSPSDLLEQPVSALANYKSFHLAISGVSEKTFDTCIFLELTFRINGRDVFQTQKEFQKKITKGLAADVPYEYDRAAVLGKQ